jgi:hypothetical protein
VQFSCAEVAAFVDSWPCSSVPERAITFCYDSSGDLVDILPYDLDYDGDDLAALSRDGNAYAAKRLKRPELARE